MFVVMIRISRFYTLNPKLHRTFIRYKTILLSYLLGRSTWLRSVIAHICTDADDKDTYKAYGKTFRKMIHECLQKDPARRPTAGELLKHSFFKKAKDRKYLMQTLVAIGPSMETRVHKVSQSTRLPI